VVLAAAAATLACGCSRSTSHDLVAGRVVSLDPLRSDRYDLLPPTVTRDQDGVVTFRGEVRRRSPGDGRPTDEHLHLDILDPKGEWIDQIALRWQPQTIPTGGERKAAYEVSYFWNPPRGTTVRLSIADDSHDTSLGSSGGGGSGTGTGSTGIAGVPGQPKGPNTPSPGGSPRQGATRTPMQPRQPGQPRTPGVPLGRSGSSRGHR
jgi:hypothetical protein